MTAFMSAEDPLSANGLQATGAAIPAALAAFNAALGGKTHKPQGRRHAV